MKITQYQLKRLVSYDPLTGVMTWRISPVGSVQAGDEVGSLNARGYRRTVIAYVHYFVHHLAWLYVYGFLPERLDHKNGKFADNRIKNLRLATTRENGRNRKVDVRNKSGATGVHFVKKIRKFRVDIKIESGRFVLANFEEFEPAWLLRLLAEQFFFGQFQRGVE